MDERAPQDRAVATGRRQLPPWHAKSRPSADPGPTALDVHAGTGPAAAPAAAAAAPPGRQSARRTLPPWHAHSAATSPPAAPLATALPAPVLPQRVLAVSVAVSHREASIPRQRFDATSVTFPTGAGVRRLSVTDAGALLRPGIQRAS